MDYIIAVRCAFPKIHPISISNLESEGDFTLQVNCLQPNMKVTISPSPSENITYHNIVAFNQKLSVEGTRNFKRLRNFPGGNLNLNDKGKKENKIIQWYNFTVVHK